MATASPCGSDIGPLLERFASTLIELDDGADRLAADPLVSYSFGQSSANAWSTGNGCTTTTTTYTNGVATCVTHGGCTAGADVVFCTIDQGGHQWPGGETLPLLGNNTTDLDATDAIWAFFVAHPKP